MAKSDTKKRINPEIRLEELNLNFSSRLHEKKKNNVRVDIAKWKKMICLFNIYSGKK